VRIREAQPTDAEVLANHRAAVAAGSYVEPSQRHNGVARAIMERILGFARQSSLISLSLHPSDPARRLYAMLGFEAADEMTLKLTD
jgi:GNAT superfamily N-acetyltransferase